MKFTKRFTALVLTLVMLMTLVAPSAWVTEAHAADVTSLNGMSFSHVNPLYQDVITEDDLVKPDRSKLNANNTDGEFYNAERAGELIRDDLVARDDTIIIDAYCESSEETYVEDAKALVYDILGYAMMHTGNPVEGDYLLWQYEGFNAQMSDPELDDGYLYLNIALTMTYLTTAQQEAEVDTAVEKLLADLNVSTADDYTKLKAIYDYICDNVTYDYDNLNNEEYNLQHTAYAALMNGTSVCQGYALLLYRLALELDVDCRLIAGTSAGQNHGWNIAEIDDLYYNLDSTWDSESNGNYEYFLVSADNFDDHTRFEEYDTAAFHQAYPMASHDYVYECTHTYEVTKTTEPTCGQAGETVYTCTICGKTYSETIAALEHSYETTQYVEATCTEDGTHTYRCTICNETTTVVLSATGHNYENTTITAATCTKDGSKVSVCSKCENVLNEVIPATGHVYGDPVVTEATCTATGSAAYTCQACDYSYIESIPMTAHSYNEGVVVEATCTSTGTITYTCADCGTSYSETLPVIDHNYTSVVVVTEPTCTKTGSASYTCEECGYVTTKTTAALGHKLDEGTVTTPATCTATGVMSYSCTVCGAITSEEIPMVDHNYVNNACTVCGKVMLVKPVILSCYSKEQTSVKVTWEPVEGADGYELFRSADPDDYNAWSLIKTIKDGTADRYTNQGLEEGVTYYYSVRAFVQTADNEREYSEYSEFSYMPAAVVWDEPYSNATTRIRLRWNEIDGAHGYQIWRLADDGETWNIVKTLGDKENILTDNQGATTAYSNTGLDAGESYTYKMRAFMITEDSRKVFGAYSDEFTVAAMPEAPVVTATSPKATRAQLAWEEVNGAAGYQIWMLDGSEWKIIKSLTDGTTTYTKSDLVSGTKYQFKVRAYTEIEGKKTFGAYSEIATVTVQ